MIQPFVRPQSALNIIKLVSSSSVIHGAEKTLGDEMSHLPQGDYLFVSPRKLLATNFPATDCRTTQCPVTNSRGAQVPQLHSGGRIDCHGKEDVRSLFTKGGDVYVTVNTYGGVPLLRMCLRFCKENTCERTHLNSLNCQ